jgi:hypothetical protein
MRVELITFRYSATLGGFDDTALVDVTRDKEVIAFREHFHSVNEVPHLSCVVHDQDAVVPQAVLEQSRLVRQRPIATERSGERFPTDLAAAWIVEDDFAPDRPDFGG